MPDQKPLTIRDVLVPFGKMYIATRKDGASSLQDTPEKAAISAGPDGSVQEMVGLRLKMPELVVLIKPEQAEDDLHIAKALAQQLGQMVSMMLHEAASRAGPQIVVAGSLPPGMPSGPRTGPGLRIVPR